MTEVRVQYIGRRDFSMFCFLTLHFLSILYHFQAIKKMNFQEANYEFVFSCIPESILCIRAVNKKARESAFTLLITIGEAIIRWGEGSQEEAIR